MALRDRYDWVVLGDHPAALLSGCLAAQQGYSVLYLSLAPSQQVFISRSGQVVDPETNFILGMGRRKGAYGLLGEALARMGGLADAESLLRTGDDVAPQVHTPESRFTLSFDESTLLHEIQREWGKPTAEKAAWTAALSTAEPVVSRWWKEFPFRLTQNPKQGMLKGASDGGRLQASIRDALITAGAARTQGAKSQGRQWLQSGARASGLASRTGRLDAQDVCAGARFAFLGSEDADPALVDLIHTLCLGRTAAAFKGGITAYRRHLLALAVRLGAYVMEDSPCRRIFVENERVMGVQMSHGGKMIGVSGAALGCSLDHAREFLSFSGKHREDMLKQAPKPSGWRFTLALTVNREAIPPGMGPRVVWQERGAPALEIEIADPVDYLSMGATGRLIFARTVLPFDQASLEPSRLRLVAARVFRQVTELLPFSEHHVTQLYPDFRDGSVEAFVEGYGFVGPQMIPDQMRCIDGPGLGCESGVEGLHVVSQESFPFLGSFGGVVAAFEAVSRFALRSGGPAERPFERLWDFMK